MNFKIMDECYDGRNTDYWGDYIFARNGILKSGNWAIAFIEGVDFLPIRFTDEMKKDVLRALKCNSR